MPTHEMRFFKSLKAIDEFVFAFNHLRCNRVRFISSVDVYKTSGRGKNKYSVYHSCRSYNVSGLLSNIDTLPF